MSNSAALTGLVESINKNKKFGGLLNYSVNCVVNLITPPNPEAALNTRQLAKSGGLEAIISAAELHFLWANFLRVSHTVVVKTGFWIVSKTYVIMMFRGV